MATISLPSQRPFVEANNFEAKTDTFPRSAFRANLTIADKNEAAERRALCAGDER
jgi:hypothetical protein